MDGNIEELSKLSLTIRNAINAVLPTADNQFLTISMPGRIIDVTRGGEFVAAEVYSASGHNKIRVNEAKLVDSMIPLSSVMLGPSGKSVTRSYLSALDHLVPRHASIDLDHLENEETTVKKSDPTRYKDGSKYNAAMQFLRRPALVKIDTEKTIVDVYREKQAAYGDAQSELEAVLASNAEKARIGGRMTADKLAIATSKMRRANNKVQGAWMDWVINGHKTMIDHHFAIVDTTTIMSRIEMGKAALRRATISDLEDSTEWARVTLSPENWATLCYMKAESWASRNPLSLEIVKMEIVRLRKMIVALKGNLQWAESKTPPNKEPSKEESAEILELKKKVTELTQSLETLKAGGDEDKIKKAEEDLQGAKKKLEEAKKENPVVDDTIPVKTNEDEEVAAFSKVVGAFHDYDEAAPKDLEKFKSVDTEQGNVSKMLKARMDNESKAVEKLVSDTSISFQKSLKEKISELEENISDLNRKLNEHTNSSSGRMKVMMGVEKVKNGNEEEWVPTEIEPKASDFILTALAQTEEKEGEADPWTTVSFTASSMKSNEATDSSSVGVSADLKVDYGVFSAGGSTNVNIASEKMTKKMEEFSVTGTFSAMLVQISRPWLHAELFEDSDIDTPTSHVLSPGPDKLKTLLSQKAKELRNFGEFPWFPTAFIVAADTELEIKCDRSDAEMLASSMSTDSNVSASYGPFVSGNVAVKTDKKSTSHRAEVTSTGMKLSFRAPQIIGWVSEILPELPRSDDAGGLAGPPMRKGN